jgi:hypothetical protein
MTAATHSVRRRNGNGTAPPPTTDIVPAVTNEAGSVLAMITKAATDPTIDVNKLERMVALYERLRAEKARTAYAEAMVAAKAAMPKVLRDAINTHTKSMYAKLETISNAIDPVINAHGFSIEFGTADSPLPNHYRVTCRLQHVAGHVENFQADIPADIAGPKGAANKNATQGFGSTLSYGRRYLKVLMWDVTILDEDTDAVPTAENAGHLINADEVRLLQKAIVETGTDLPRYLAHLGVARLEEITIGQYGRARHALKQKAIANAKKGAATDAA